MWNLESDITLARINYQSAESELAKAGLRINVCGQKVLDVGCGLGGKTVYYAEQGARLVVGVEIAEKRAHVAMKFASHHPAGKKVKIVRGDAMRLPFRKDAFDQVISTDTLEHLHDPVLSIREWLRVVKSGGIISISTMPYYSPWGAHIYDWLPLPWLQLVLPRLWLFRLTAWIDQYRQINKFRPPSVRVDWTNFDDPAHARLLTVAKLESAVTLVGISILLFEINPIGAKWGKTIASIIRALTHLPILREILAGTVVVVLQKP